MLMGDDESHPWLSAKASRWMCKFFQTNLSLTCCLPATPSSLGIPILALWILGLFCRSAIYGASICAIIMAFFVICFTVLSTTKDGEYFAIQRFRLR
ncbi:hypothetical protein CEF09_03375 [Vibrio cholerae]|nr:hypothetical protein CEF09_03375 [Vibrio cholerae]